MIRLSIDENYPLNTEVIKVNCTDPDSTVAGGSGAPDVLYGFGGGNINETFAIDPVSC